MYLRKYMHVDQESKQWWKQNLSVSKTYTVFGKKNLIPTVRSGDCVMVVCCFAASGPGRLAVNNETMNSALYQEIPKENIWASVHALKLKSKTMIQNSIKKKNKWKKPSTTNKISLFPAIMPLIYKQASSTEKNPTFVQKCDCRWTCKYM